MKKLLIMLVLLSSTSFAADDMTDVPSQFDVKQTADRLVTVLNKKGMTVFNRIDHADGAKGVGIEINPAELILFGNPKVGSPLMQCQPSIVIDLLQKALIWQDAAGKVWLSYNDPEYLKQRHDVKNCDANFEKITLALAGLTKAAAQDDSIVNK